MILVQNQGPSRGSSPSRNQGGGSSAGGGGAHHSASSFSPHQHPYAAFPSSFQLPSNEHVNNPTLVNILAPTPIKPVEGMEGGPSSILDYIPTNELPNSSFLPSLSSSASPTNQGAAGPFSMDSDLSGSPFDLIGFDASDLSRNLLDGSNGGGQQQLFSSGLPPFANDASSFLDLGTLQSTMDIDTGAINPYDFDPTFGGGATSDSEGYISSAASTDGSSMRMGPYFASRKRPSEDASSGTAYPGGLGAGASKPRKPRSVRAGSVGRSSSSKQDLPTAFGSLGGQSAREFPPPSSSSSSSVPPQAKRRKSFSITSPDSSNSPPSPSSTSNLSTTSGGGGPLDGPLRRTNSNPHPASFSFTQPTPAQNAFILPRSQSNSPAQPIPQIHSRNPSPFSSSSLYAQRPQPFPSSSVPNNIPTSSSHTFTPSFNQLRTSFSRPNSSAASSSTSHSAYSSSTTNGNGYHPKSPSSSAASSSGAPSLGLNPVVETSLEWVPSKPRIRKSIRRRLEKKRDEPQRMVHVLEGRPPPAVEINLPKSSRNSAGGGGKPKKGAKSRESTTMGGVTAGEESGTEGGGRRKPSFASSSLQSNKFGPPSSSSGGKKIRTGSVSSMDGPSSKAGRATAKGKGKAAKKAGAESDVDSSGEDDNEEEGEAKMERMMKSFEHLGTELPPRVYEGGVSPLMPERKKGKIPGSAMDRLPAIDARFAALEKGIESYLKAVARRSLQNSMLPGLAFPSSDIQEIWEDLGGKGIYQPQPSYHDEEADDELEEY